MNSAADTLLISLFSKIIFLKQWTQQDERFGKRWSVANLQMEVNLDSVKHQLGCGDHQLITFNDTNSTNNTLHDIKFHPEIGIEIFEIQYGENLNFNKFTLITIMVQ